MQPQRALDLHFPIAEPGVGKNLGFGRFLEFQKRTSDALDVFRRQ